MSEHAPAQDATVDRLLFVYDADSGVLSAALDVARKALRLRSCSLCAITHGLVGEKHRMRTCRQELGVLVAYVHRDEVSPAVAPLVADALPAVVAETPSGPVLLLGPEVIDRCKGSVEDLRGELLHYASRLGLCL